MNHVVKPSKPVQPQAEPAGARWAPNKTLDELRSTLLRWGARVTTREGLKPRRSQSACPLPLIYPATAGRELMVERASTPSRPSLQSSAGELGGGPRPSILRTAGVRAGGPQARPLTSSKVRGRTAGGGAVQCGELTCPCATAQAPVNALAHCRAPDIPPRAARALPLRPAGPARRRAAAAARSRRASWRSACTRCWSRARCWCSRGRRQPRWTQPRMRRARSRSCARRWRRAGRRSRSASTSSLQ